MADKYGMRCSWVDHVMVVNLDGYTRPCCQASDIVSRIAPISKGIGNAWTAIPLIRLRSELEHGYTAKTKPICHRCEKAEVAGIHSLRTSSDFFPEETQPGLKGIQFKLSNRCQLACAHCEPYLSSTWAKLKESPIFIRDAIPKNDHETFIDDVIKSLPTLSWIKFTGGEPWMDPLHWKLMDRLHDVDKSHCELHYISNGLAKFDVAAWKGWKKVKISVSVDGHGESFEWFRRGASWNKLIANIDTLSKLDNVEVSISYCITPWTVEYWAQAKEYWKFPITPQPVLTPWHSSLESLGTETIKLPEDTPFKELIGNKTVNIEKLRTWALDWDVIWKTEGSAMKLYPWLFKN